MAETDCRPQVQACAIRVARLESDGVPLPGASNLYVSDALVTATFTPVYTDGEEIEEKTACGVVGVSHRSDDTFKRGDFSLQIITPDPFLQEMLTNGTVLDPGGGAPKGYGAPSLGVVSGDAISIEVWAKRIDEGDLDANYPYAHWAYPKIKNLRLAEHEHSNSALMPSFSGQAYENENWYDGPVGDWTAASDKVFQWIPAASLPVASCGYQTLAAT